MNEFGQDPTGGAAGMVGKMQTGNISPGDVASKIEKGDIKGAIKLAATAGASGAAMAFGVPPPVNVIVGKAAVEIVGKIGGAIGSAISPSWAKTHAYIGKRRAYLIAQGQRIQEVVSKLGLEGDLLAIGAIRTTQNGIGYDWFVDNIPETHQAGKAPPFPVTARAFSAKSALLLKLASTKLALRNKALQDKATKKATLAQAMKDARVAEKKIAKKEENTKTSIGVGGGALVGLAIAGPIGAAVGGIAGFVASKLV